MTESLFDAPKSALAEPKVTLKSRRHSRLGITAFLLSLFCWISFFIVIVMAVLLIIENPEGMAENSKNSILLGLSILFLIFLSVLAVILGIAGLLQRNTRKVFSILGIVLPLVLAFMLIGLIVIGIYA